jgi:hypothetical protein
MLAEAANVANLELGKFSVFAMPNDCKIECVANI